MKRRLGQAFVVIASVFGAACTDVSELSPRYQIRETSDGLDITAYFLDTDGDYFADAHVTASLRGQTFTMKKVYQGYSTSIALDTPLVLDESVAITMERDGDTLVSTVAAPPPVDLDTPPLFISRDKPLTLTWSTISDDGMWWSVDSFSVTGQGEIPAGVNTFTIPAKTLKGPERLTRTATLRVIRVRIGDVDPGFAGGEMGLLRAYTIDFASTP